MPKSKPVELLQPGWLAERLDDEGIRVFDARSRGEYAQEHVPGSFSLPLDRLLAEEGQTVAIIALNEHGINDDVLVVVYDDSSGIAASRLVWTLQRAGHEKVGMLSTSLSGWKKLGFSTDSKTSKPKKSDYAPKENPDIEATPEYLRMRSGSPETALVDTSPRLNYLDGHLAGAVTMPWRMFSDGESILLPKQRLKQLIDEHRLGDREVILYSDDGVSAALVYYGFRLAEHERVRLCTTPFRELGTLGLNMERIGQAYYQDLRGTRSV